MYIWWVLNFSVVVFQGKLAKPCCNARTFQVVSKRPPIASTVLSSTNTVIGAFVYRGIPSDLRSRPEQSHQLPGACPPPGSVSTGSLQSSMGIPCTFNSTEKAPKFTIYDYILTLLLTAVKWLSNRALDNRVIHTFMVDKLILTICR